MALRFLIVLLLKYYTLINTQMCLYFMHHLPTVNLKNMFCFFLLDFFQLHIVFKQRIPAMIHKGSKQGAGIFTLFCMFKFLDVASPDFHLKQLKMK